MKIKIIAGVLLFCVLGAVFGNALLLDKKIGEIAEKVDTLPSLASEEEIQALFEEYASSEKFFGLSVSHEDLMNIEQDFADLSGAAKAKDAEAFTQAKSRLSDALSHLRRLSGINPDSILFQAKTSPSAR